MRTRLLNSVPLSTSVGAPKRPRRFAPLQALAGLACAVLTLMVAAAGLNGLFGGVETPQVFRTWIGVTHAVLMLSILLLTTVQIVLPKGTGLHRKIGYAWGGALISASLISFGMHEINGGWSGPHYFSAATLILVPLIAYLGITGRRRTHRVVVVSYVVVFLVVAGAFTFKGDRALGLLFWPLLN